MKTVLMDRGDFWELKGRALEYTAQVEKAKALAQKAAADRDALVQRMAEKYGFDAARDFTMDDSDLSVQQGEG